MDDLLPDVPRPPARYSVTITVQRDDDMPGPAAYAVAAEREAARMAGCGVVSAHTAHQVVTVVTVDAAGGDEAAAAARAVVAGALGRGLEVRETTVARG